MGESKWPCNDIPRFVTVVRKGQDILTIRQQPLSVIRINRVVRCRGFTYHVRVELWIRCDDVMWQTGTSQNRQQQMLVDRSTGMVEQNGGCVLEKHRSSSMWCPHVYPPHYTHRVSVMKRKRNKFVSEVFAEGNGKWISAFINILLVLKMLCREQKTTAWRTCLNTECTNTLVIATNNHLTAFCAVHKTQITLKCIFQKRWHIQLNQRAIHTFKLHIRFLKNVKGYSN